MVEKFLTPDDLAEAWKIPRSWIYEHTRRGTDDPLPHFRLGKHLRFRVAEIEEWIQNHRKK